MTNMDKYIQKQLSIEILTIPSEVMTGRFRLIGVATYDT